MADRPGKHPKTGEPQGGLNSGGNWGNAFNAGRKITEETGTVCKSKAPALIALGEYSRAKIAELVGVRPETIGIWMRDPKFVKKVEDAKEQIHQAILQEGIGNRLERVKRLHTRWNQIDEVFLARAEDPSHALQPGWTTGLLCHEQRSLGSGELATVVDIYKVDIGTIKEERELAKQAAQELGQWTEKTQTTVDLSKLSDEDLENLERISSKLGS